MAKITNLKPNTVNKSRTISIAQINLAFRRLAWGPYINLQRFGKIYRI